MPRKHSVGVKYTLALQASCCLLESEIYCGCIVAYSYRRRLSSKSGVEQLLNEVV